MRVYSSGSKYKIRILPLVCARVTEKAVTVTKQKTIVKKKKQKKLILKTETFSSVALANVSVGQMDHRRRLDAATVAQVALQVLILLSSPTTVVRGE